MDELIEIVSDKKWLIIVILVLFLGLCFLLVETSSVSSKNRFYEEQKAKWQENFDRGMKFYESNQFDSALVCFNSSQSKVEYWFDSLEIKSKRWKAECFYEIGDLDSAMYYAKNVSKYNWALSSRKSLAQRPDYSEIKEAHLILGRIFKQQNQQRELLRNYYLMIELSKERKDTIGVIRGYEQLVLASEEMNLETFPLQMLVALDDYLLNRNADKLSPEVAEIIFPKFVDLLSRINDGLELLKKVLDEDEKTSIGAGNTKFSPPKTDTIFEFYAHLKFSEILRNQQNFDSAKTHINKAYHLAPYTSLPRSELLVNLEKGKVCLGERDFYEADSIFRAVLSYNRTSVSDSIEAMLALSESLLAQEKYNDIFSIGSDLMNLLEKEKDLKQAMKFFSVVAMVMQRTGDIVSALESLEFRDSFELNISQQVHKSSGMDLLASIGMWDGIVSGFENSEVDLQEVKEDLELQKIKSKKSLTFYRIGLVFLTLLIILLLGYLLYQSLYSLKNLSKRSITLPNNVRIILGDVFYLKKEPNTNAVYYVFRDNTKIKVHDTSLEKIEESGILPKRLFKRIHRSYIVNVLRVKSRVARDNELILENEERIKYSRKAKDLVDRILNSQN